MSPADRLRSASLLAGCSGAVVFLALLVSGPQDLREGATGDEVRRFLESNLNGIGWLVFAQAVAFGALLLFVVGLRSLMRAGEEPGGLLGDLATVGGLLTAVSFSLKASLDMVPLVMADDYGKLTPYDDRTLRALDLLNRFGETVGDVATVPRGLLVLARVAARPAEPLPADVAGLLRSGRRRRVAARHRESRLGSCVLLSRLARRSFRFRGVGAGGQRRPAAPAQENFGTSMMRTAAGSVNTDISPVAGS